jgi:hypothetical protein
MAAALNQAFVDTYFKATDGSGQGGIKLANVRPAISPGFVRPAPHSNGSSDLLSEAPGVGLQLMHGQRLHGAYAAFEAGRGPYDFKLQNGTAPYCLYSQQAWAPATAGPNCFAWVSNEWMTFQMGITLGARDNVKNEFVNSRVRLRGHARPAITTVDRLEAGHQRIFPLTAGCLPTMRSLARFISCP